jgi:hypothetical protein
MATASITLSNDQRRVLALMGVDVWVRRGVSQPPPVVAAEPGVVARVEPETVARVEPAPVAGPRPIPLPQTADVRASLDCIAARGVLVIGDFANPLDRRLAQDIVLAMAGMTADLQRAQFRWPQTQTGDSTLAAARNAYRGFLRGQIERAGARQLLLLGSSADALLDSESGLGEVQIYRFSDARALRADPLEKKRLWLSVSPHVRA